MKIAIIGAGGVRTPLLVAGLTSSDLAVRSIALYDPDRQRLGRMASVARRYAGSAALELADTSASSIEGADFVVATIRVGGIEARFRDEETAVQLGVIGQETVGAAGFAMAMRTVPRLVDYAREVERLAPRAWMINFTNPVGITTQAVRKQTAARLIGICDTPSELFEQTAHLLHLDPQECRFDYFGLNHLGWLREVIHRGEPQLHRLWDDVAALGRVYRTDLFSPRFLRSLRLLPNEYLYFYYRSTEALANIRRAGRTRGVAIQQLNEHLFRELAESGCDPAEIYEAYLAERDAGYMQIETASTSRLRANRDSVHPSSSGYNKIALSVIRAIANDSGDTIAVDVANQGTLPDLEDQDVIEVPSTVDRGGARPLPVDPIPDPVRDLLIQVKDYERLTVEAALTRSRETAVEALVRNPLVGDAHVAHRLLERLAVE